MPLYIADKQSQVLLKDVLADVLTSRVPVPRWATLLLIRSTPPLMCVADVGSCLVLRGTEIAPPL